MRPNGLHAVGNGVSLLPWMKITGVRVSGPAAPKPISGLCNEVSSIAGKPSGSVLPTVPPAAASAQASAAAKPAANERIERVVIVIASPRVMAPGSSREEAFDQR